MKTIDQYTIYCTKEQTQKAFELGASIVKMIEEFNAIPSCYVDKSNNLYEIPTAEQMIGWLEEQGFEFEESKYYTSIDYKDKGCLGMFEGLRKDSVLIAIDTALDYLISKKK